MYQIIIILYIFIGWLCWLASVFDCDIFPLKIVPRNNKQGFIQTIHNYSRRHYTIVSVLHGLRNPPRSPNIQSANNGMVFRDRQQCESDGHQPELMIKLSVVILTNVLQDP